MLKKRKPIRKVLAFMCMLALVATSLFVAPLSAEADANVNINWNTLQQRIDGFGGSEAWLVSGLYDNFDVTTQNQVFDLLFSTTNGIGLSIIRFRVPYDLNETDAGTLASHWQVNADIKFWNRAKTYGVTTAFATPWSPPGWMKENDPNHQIGGSNNENGGRLQAIHYYGYADYLAKYIKLMGDNGVPISAISVQNEPNNAGPGGETCFWTPENMRDFIKGALKSKLNEYGLSTKIMGCEQVGWTPEYVDTVLADPDASSKLDIVAAHHYGAYGDQNFTNAQAAGKTIWQTETSDFTTYEPRSADMSISDGLRWANQLHDTFTQANANAFNWWWMFKESKLNVPNEFETTEELITLDNAMPAGQKAVVHKRLFALGQYSRFIRPGYYRLNSTTWSDGVSVTAYKNPSAPNQLIIVAINNNTTQTRMNATLNGVSCSNATVYRTSATENLQNVGTIAINGSNMVNDLAPQSITTFVATVAGGSTNVALNKPTVASSEWSSSNNSSYGVDGSIGTIWASDGTQDNPCWQVDLGTPTVIKKIEMVARQDMDQPGARSNFRIWASNDNFATYTELGSQGSTPFPAYGTWTLNVSNPTAFRYVRLQRITGGHINFSEFRVFN